MTANRKFAPQDYSKYTTNEGLILHLFRRHLVSYNKADSSK